MTVRELIDALQKFPPEMTVDIHAYECDCSPEDDLSIVTVEIVGQKTPRVVIS